MHTDLLALLLTKRTGRDVLLERVIGEPTRDIYHARVSADDGKTWGWHRVTRRELVEIDRPR